MVNNLVAWYPLRYTADDYAGCKHGNVVGVPRESAWYRFTGDVKDSSGYGNNGSDFNITYMQDGDYFAGLFNGVNSYGNISHNTNLLNNLSGVNPKSVFFWVKPMAYPTDSFAGLVSLGSNSNNSMFSINYASNGSLYYNGGSNPIIIGSLALNEWAHVGMTFLNGAVQVYRNGSLLSTGSRAWKLNPISGTIGMLMNGSGFFNGYMDDIRIYNDYLKPTEVLKLYNIDNGTDSALSLCSSGVAIFDGYNDYVNCGNRQSFVIPSGTLATWIKTSDAGTFKRGLIVKSLSYNLFLIDNKPGFYNWGSGTSGVQIQSAVTVNDNAWHHIALTYADKVENGANIFVDGSLILTNTINSSSDSQPIYLGCGGSLDVNKIQYYGGEMKDTRIYSNILSQTDIKNLYNNGSGIITKNIGWQYE